MFLQKFHKYNRQLKKLWLRSFASHNINYSICVIGEIIRVICVQF